MGLIYAKLIRKDPRIPEMNLAEVIAQLIQEQYTCAFRSTFRFGSSWWK